jgi:hypothetical protein
MVNARFDFADIFQEENRLDLELHEKELREAVAAARACVNNEKFIVYKQRIEKLLLQMPDVLISFTNEFFAKDEGDMAFYGAKMARYVTKVQNLRLLLKAVEQDSGKTLKQGEDNG